MSEKMYIYALCDANGDVRYIGQTNDMTMRMCRHCCDAKSGRDKTRKGEWLRTVVFVDRQESASINRIILETCTRDDANEKERKWYWHYKASGADLLNDTFKNEPKQ